MSRQRDLILNFERMWREVDELMGEPWPEVQRGRNAGAQPSFTPRVDVYYCGEDQPRAIVMAELAGIDIEQVSLEVSGRDLVIAGERILRTAEGRVYQQVEVETGPFRRVVHLHADVVAASARASYDDGILRVELPLRLPEGEVSTSVPITTRKPEENH